LLTQRNPSLTCFRMPEDVGEGLLNDAKDCSFQIAREPWEISRLYLSPISSSNGGCKRWDRPSPEVTICPNTMRRETVCLAVTP
jgi:hypothetical protein